MKLCTKCGVGVEFHKDRSKKDLLHSICKTCHSIHNSTKRKENPAWRAYCVQKSKEYRETYGDKIRLAIVNANLKKKYNLTLQDYNILLEQQSGVCLICKHVPVKQRLHVDHNHQTGKIRGLLCQACNVSIGKMKENPKLLRDLANYVEKHHQNPSA